MGNGSQILMERRRKNIRQADLAAAMGLRQGTLLDIERERIPVGADLLSMALKAMDGCSSTKEQKGE